MWVFREVYVGGYFKYEVGYFAPDGHFVECFTYENKKEACDRVHWLNGGSY